MIRDNLDDVIIRGVNSIINQSGGTWKGTMSQLSSALIRVLSKKQRTLLPDNPRALRSVIDRVVYRIRSRGIGVRFGRTTDHTRTRFVRFAQ